MDIKITITTDGGTLISMDLVHFREDISDLVGDIIVVNGSSQTIKSITIEGVEEE